MLQQKEIVRYGLENATFLIPLRIESADRMRNIITVLIYLCRNFKTNIIIHELDQESIFKSAVVPQLEQALLPEEMCMIFHIFEKTDDYTFHRTRLLNDMAIAAKTKVVVNYDSDIILPQLSYIKAVDYILNGFKFFFQYVKSNGIYIIEDFKHPNYYTYNKNINHIFIDELLNNLQNKKISISKVFTKNDQIDLMNQIEKIESHKGNLDDSDIAFISKK